MRHLMWALLAAGTVTAAASSPAAAGPLYPYCLQLNSVGTDCSYPTYEACQMTASGRGASCIVNPVIAFNPQPESYRQPIRRGHTYRVFE